MTDPDEHLSDRLAGLGSGPAPRMSTASEVRARGEQRRRRGRAALTGTGIAVLLMGGAGAWALTERDTREGLQVAEEDAPEEVVCFGGGVEPVEEGTVVPRDEVCPEQTPSSSPEQSASPEPAESDDPSTGDVSTALLTPEEAAQAEAESWRYGDEEPEPGPLLDPCDERTFPRAEDVRASDEGVLQWRREESGAIVRQEVFRYRSAEAAQQAFAEYADRVQRCPRRPVPDDPNGSTTRFDVVDRTEAGGGQQLLVRQTACNPACIANFRSYLAVAQQADLLTVLTYGQFVDGDPQSESAAVLKQAARTLADTVGGS